jgi:hypothetical protein
LHTKSAFRVRGLKTTSGFSFGNIRFDIQCNLSLSLSIGLIMPNDRNMTPDRDDEILGNIRNERLKVLGPKESQTFKSPHASRPLAVNSEELMGRMPKPEKVQLEEVLLKLTSKYEWKRFKTVLTNTGLFLARDGEDVLCDLIPLHEVHLIFLRKCIYRNLLKSDSDRS